MTRFGAGVVGVLTLAGLGWWLRAEDRRFATPPITDPLREAVPLVMDRVPEVARAVRSMQLVTVEVQTSVTSTAGDAGLLGAVNAKVTVPVRVLYATDLSKIESSAIMFSPIHRAYLVRVPTPTRIAAEVLGQFEQAEVSTGWLRSRASTGEFFLGLARRGVHAQAQDLLPTVEQAAEIREGTREQVRALVQSIVGAGTPVQVRLEDERGGT
jgi:hypothetical protein